MPNGCLGESQCPVQGQLHGSMHPNLAPMRSAPRGASSPPPIFFFFACTRGSRWILGVGGLTEVLDNGKYEAVSHPARTAIMWCRNAVFLLRSKCISVQIKSVFGSTTAQRCCCCP